MVTLMGAVIHSNSFASSIKQGWTQIQNFQFHSSLPQQSEKDKQTQPSQWLVR